MPERRRPGASACAGLALALSLVAMAPPATALPADTLKTVLIPAVLRARVLHGEAGAATLPARYEGPSHAASPASPADRRDPWLGFDKVQHATFGFLWTLGCQYALVNKAGMSEEAALPLSAGGSAAVGLAKEVYDRYRGPTRYFSTRDLAADAFGILVAAAFTRL